MSLDNGSIAARCKRPDGQLRNAQAAQHNHEALEAVAGDKAVPTLTKVGRRRQDRNGFTLPRHPCDIQPAYN
jgi:hypothetical protein